MMHSCHGTASRATTTHSGLCSTSVDTTGLADVPVADFDRDETIDSVFGHDPARYLLRADSLYADAL